jgi:hypothetical protein
MQKSTLSIKQYIASLRRVSSCPPDLRTQTNMWPYPQARQSHLAIWRDSWPQGDGIPVSAIRISLINTDIPGSLVRVAPGELMPSEAIAKVLQVE